VTTTSPSKKNVDFKDVISDNNTTTTTNMSISNQYLCKKVLMVQPTKFGTNEETLTDNYFMSVDSDPENTKLNAILEFNKFAESLRQKGVEVMVYPQCCLEAVDSVFPNNWFSTHKNENIPGT
jgi:hypothetical protein